MRNILMKKMALLTVFALLAAVNLLPAQDGSFTVVVNSSNPSTTMSKEQVRQIFLKKTSKWENGTKAVPVDQAEDRPVRRSFTSAVHGKRVSAIKSYWQKMIFSGRATPPSEKSGDREVLAFVARNPGAIGYVSSGTSLGNRVQAVRLRN